MEERNPEACLVGVAIEEMGSQWPSIVFSVQQEEEKRFNDLKRSTGASSRAVG